MRAYKAGDDKPALQRKAEKVRDELKPRIPSAAKLLEPVKVAAADPAAPLHLLGRTELPGYSGDFDHFAVDIAAATACFWPRKITARSRCSTCTAANI